MILPHFSHQEASKALPSCFFWLYLCPIFIFYSSKIKEGHEFNNTITRNSANKSIIKQNSKQNYNTLHVFSVYAWVISPGWVAWCLVFRSSTTSTCYSQLVTVQVRYHECTVMIAYVLFLTNYSQHYLSNNNITCNYSKSHLLYICDWIYGNCFKLHIGSYEIIDSKGFKAL